MSDFVEGMRRDIIKELRQQRDEARAERDDTHAALVRRHKDLAEWQQRAEAAEAKLARLENPDEALVEAVREWNRGFDEPSIRVGDESFVVGEILTRLARTLTEGENSDG